MKIAFTLGGLPFGGVEALHLSLAKELRRQGHSPIIINISGTGEMESQFEEAGFEPLRVGVEKSALKTANFLTTFNLRRLIKKIKPDIIHSSHFSANYHVRMAALGLGIPVVVHWHNIKNEEALHRVLANKILSYATDLNIGVAEEVVEKCVTSYNIANRPCVVVYNGIDSCALDSAKQVSLNGLVHSNGPILFSACRIVKQKRMDLAVFALKKIKEAFGTASLLVVGDGKERDMLLELAHDLNLHNDVFLPGFRTDVFGIMKALSKRKTLYVAPSDYEGFGLAALEALHFGIPALVSPYVPLKEVAKGALRVCDQDVESIFHNAKDILNDDLVYSEMSVCAKDAARRNTTAVRAQELLNVYKGLLKI